MNFSANFELENLNPKTWLFGREIDLDYQLLVINSVSIDFLGFQEIPNYKFETKQFKNLDLIMDFEIDSDFELNTDFIYDKGTKVKFKPKKIKKIEIIEPLDDDF